MRPSLVVLVAALALAACEATTVYYAEGVDLPTRAADFAQCEAQSLREYPALTEIRYTPRLYVPAEYVCTEAGACSMRPGRFEGGEPYTLDANADPRRVATRGCMGERGYARVGLPFCERDSAVHPSLVMAPLTEETCLYRPAGSGQTMVVNPL